MNTKTIDQRVSVIVAIVCFILATGFIVQLSLVSGWLTPERQITVASLLGISLLAAGIFISNTDFAFASMLPAAGTIILYLTAFASYSFYHIISVQTLYVFASFISAICILNFIQFKHDMYAIISAIGAYSAVLLVPIETYINFSLYYIILCSFTFATISILVSSRILTVISSYLAIIITAYLGMHLQINKTIALILLVNFIIFSIGSYFHTQISKRAMTLMEVWSLFPVLVLFYAIEYYFVYRIQPQYAPWVSLAALMYLIVLYYLAQKREPSQQLNSNMVLISFASVVCYHSIYIELIPDNIKPWLFVIIILGYSVLHTSGLLAKMGITISVPLLALASILGIEYLDLLSKLTSKANIYYTGAGWTAVLSLWFAYFRHHAELIEKRQYAYFVITAAHLLFMMDLYQLTSHSGSLAITCSWLLYAVAVLIYSQVYRDNIAAKSILIVLACTAGRTLLYDAQVTSAFITSVNLILTGVVLYATRLIIKKL